MKLRWRLVKEKKWVTWTHKGGALDGVEDGGYAYEPTGERVLQYYDDVTGEWVDVPDEGTE